jgi:hypothetical protein
MAVAPADAPLMAWLATHPAYTYTVEATELDAAGRLENVTLHISYDASGPLELVHIVNGKAAGADITWHGTDAVVVHPGGIFHALGIPMSVRDKRVLSPRGNDVRVGIFANVAACFARNPNVLRSIPAPGQMAFELVDPDGVDCGADDGSGAERVTRDRIVCTADGRPLRRERYIGSELVETWTISDLQPL